MKYYIIAGEASGDLYGSRLITEIKSLDKNAEIRFWGGDKMILSGGTKTFRSQYICGAGHL